MNPKRQRFVDEFPTDLSATGAARRAGYAHPDRQGPRLMCNVEIQQAIAKRYAARSRRLQVNADQVLEGLMAETKRITPLSDGPSSARVRAWELIGRHLGMAGLAPPGLTVNVQNNTIMAPWWSEIRAAIIAALQPFPSARAAVVGAVERVEAASAGDGKQIKEETT